MCVHKSKFDAMQYRGYMISEYQMPQYVCVRLFWSTTNLKYHLLCYFKRLPEATFTIIKSN